MHLNPYSDESFWGFFVVLFTRLKLWMTGHLPFDSWASDEIQMATLVCVAISTSLVGTFLVLRKMTMLANALSHTMLLGIVVAFLISHDMTIPTLMISALVTGLITTFLTAFFNQVIKLQEDASIGLIFSTLFALGVLLLMMYGRNMHVGTELIMGNVDALQKGDLKLVGSVLGINLLLFFIFYQGFKITTFDSNLARTFGFSPVLFNYLLMVQMSGTSVAAFKAVGVLMVMAFLVLPPLTARLLTHKLSYLIGLAVAIGSGAALCGVALSRHILTFCGFGLSTGGIVVVVLGLFYCLAVALKWCIDFSTRKSYSHSFVLLGENEKNCNPG